MKLSEDQIKIIDKTMFLKDIYDKIPSLDIVDRLNATEMTKLNNDLRFTIFKKIERMMMISPFYKDLYSVSLPNETKLHEEKLRYMRIFVGQYKDKLEYTDRLKFTFTLIDPDCKYDSGIYEQYSKLNFDAILNDGRKIIKSMSGNFRLLHQRNMKTLEQFEIYESPNSDFIYRLCFYPNKKAWIELESRE